MSRSRWFFPALPVLVLFFVFASLGLSASAAAQQPRFDYSPFSCETWNYVYTPSVFPYEYKLDAVTAISSSDIWAVGKYRLPWNPNHTLAEHFNGEGWTIVATPDGPLSSSRLTAVDSMGAGNVWAVGFSASDDPSNPRSKTLVEQWNGSSWNVVDSPNPPMLGRMGGGETTNELYGVRVAGPDDVWVVGKTANLSDSQSLILHWDGLQWTNFSTPDDGPAGWLTAIDVVAPEDIWAVGFDSVNFVQVNLIKHWDGHHWENFDAPNADPDGNQLRAVSAISTESVWAVGTSILYWNGSVWTVVESPQRDLLGVVGIASGSAWAVGPGGYEDTSFQKWDGFAWNLVAFPEFLDPYQLSGIVSVGPDEAWAVGWFVVPDEPGLEPFAAHLFCPGMRGTRTVKR